MNSSLNSTFIPSTNSSSTPNAVSSSINKTAILSKHHSIGALGSLKSSLLTDMYEITMIDGVIKSGRAYRHSIFELFGRRLPGGRRYGVVAGTGRMLEAISNFRFDAADIEYLLAAKVVDPETANFLADYKFTGNIWGYPEGEIYFPGSPLLTVEAPFAQAVVIETLLLSIYNHDCAVATAASRMTVAAHGRPCLEMGGRRTHELAAVAAARAAFVGGFAGTSILEAGRSYGLPVIGTAAHSFTLVHDSEEEAFSAQIQALGTNTTLLVDTYNTPAGVEKAVKAARAAGGELGAVRLDSGDLVAQAFQVRKQLDDLESTATKITVTSDLDEYAIAALGAAPVDAYGVGTKLVTGSGCPTAELVYKLVSRAGDDFQMYDVAKKSQDKNSVGGLKVAGRIFNDEGQAVEELVVACPDRASGLAYLEAQGARPLQVDLVQNGEIVASHCDKPLDSLGNHKIGQVCPVLQSAALRHEHSRAQLPYDAWRLSAGEPGIPTRLVHIDNAI